MAVRDQHRLRRLYGWSGYNAMSPVANNIYRLSLLAQTGATEICSGILATDDETRRRKRRWWWWWCKKRREGMGSKR